MTNRFRFLRLAAPVFALFLAAGLFLNGCSDDPLSPYEPEISNDTDTFSLQATGVRNVSLVREYVWMNTGTRANVNQATTIDKGSATLRIYDGEDNEVYVESLATNGTSTTSAGASGAWTLRLVLADYSGTINFSTEAP